MSIFCIYAGNSADNIDNETLLSNARTAFSTCTLAQDVFCFSCHPTGEEAVDAQVVGMGHSCLKRYSLPYVIMFSMQSWRKKMEEGYHCNDYICLLKSQLLIMEPHSPGDG